MQRTHWLGLFALCFIHTANAREFAAHWVSQPAPTAKSLRAIGGNKEVHIVGDGGTILAQNGSTWREMGIADGIKPDLFSVIEVNGDSYAVGTFNETAVFVRRAGGAWQSLAIDVASAVPAALYGVWGNTKDVYMVGKKGKAFRFSVDTGKFFACGDAKTTSDLFAVTGNIRDGSVYAVGAAGTILRTTDGCATWANVSNKVVSGADLTSVAISASDDVYVVGKDGAVLVSKDKGSFTNISSRLPASSPRNFSSIIVKGNDIFIASREGKVLHSIDYGQTFSVDTSCAQGALTSLWGNANGEIYVVGEFGSILKAPASTTLEIQVRDNVATFNGAEVYIDGELYKPLPLAGPIQMSPGRHFIQVKKSSFVDFSQWIDIIEGRTTPLWITALRSSSINPSLTLNVTNGKQALADATIMVNGLVNKTPVNSPIELAPGRYLIEVEKANYEKFSAWVELHENQKNQISVLLQEATQEPKLDLLHKPEDASLLKGANIYFDGELVGPFPLAKPPVLSPGRHLIEVRKENYEDFAAWVTLKKGEVTTLYLSLRLTPADVFLEIKTKPEDAATIKGAEVVIDGDVVGALPLAKAPTLSLGRHHIEIRKSGYQSESYWLSIKAGDSASISYYPEASKEALLQIDGEKGAPGLEGATLWVDGLSWGALPQAARSIPSGRHLLEIKKDGFATYSQWIDVAKDKGRFTKVVTVRLEPNKTEAPKPEPSKPPASQPIAVP
jgi:photosystem II stability/assembly factor-like uncharacterized protein